MNPAAVWGCDIKNKEDTHKNAAHAVDSTWVIYTLSQDTLLSHNSQELAQEEAL